MKYQVVLKKSQEGFQASCPTLPGCQSQGKTEIEAMENIKKAIRDYIAEINEELIDSQMPPID